MPIERADLAAFETQAAAAIAGPQEPREFVAEAVADDAVDQMIVIAMQYVLTDRDARRSSIVDRLGAAAFDGDARTVTKLAASVFLTGVVIGADLERLRRQREENQNGNSD